MSGYVDGELARSGFIPLLEEIRRVINPHVTRVSQHFKGASSPFIALMVTPIDSGLVDAGRRSTVVCC